MHLDLNVLRTYWSIEAVIQYSARIRIVGLHIELQSPRLARHPSSHEFSGTSRLEPLPVAIHPFQPRLFYPTSHSY